jgi:hypothetical protein
VKTLSDSAMQTKSGVMQWGDASNPSATLVR